MKHGWTGHGAPCCEKAPVFTRPDEVAACGGPNGHAGLDRCELCPREALMLHLDGMDVPRLFDESAFWARGYVRFAYQGATTTAPTWSGLITGIS